ncbi:Rid family hydrolase [Jiangella muralis]|uniref:Rid family hydrolase n=1 Tax=Jiangella muralis TaxID=702383 RepID=UPI00069FF056|nr:Rid family hydrolase [Jiangella muralis]
MRKPTRRLTAVAAASSLATLAITGSVVAVTGIGAPRPQEVRFNIAAPTQAPDPFIANGVAVGNQVPLYFSSGIGPGALNPAAPAGTPERYIDPAQFPGGVLPAGVTVTEAQGMNAMARIRENLESQGLSLSNVISMRIYLEAPPGTERADYNGWNRAYRKWMANVNRVTGEVIPAYTPVEFANDTRPSRTNLEVDTLPVAGWLVEIEVVAAYTKR